MRHLILLIITALFLNASITYTNLTVPIFVYTGATTASCTLPPANSGPMGIDHCTNASLIGNGNWPESYTVEMFISGTSQQILECTGAKKDPAYECSGYPGTPEYECVAVRWKWEYTIRNEYTCHWQCDKDFPLPWQPIDLTPKKDCEPKLYTGCVGSASECKYVETDCSCPDADNNMVEMGYPNPIPTTTPQHNAPTMKSGPISMIQTPHKGVSKTQKPTPTNVKAR